MSNEIEQAGRIIRDDMNAQAHGQRHGMPSIYTCPACGGVLWQLDEYGISRFQCHTGHIYSIQHLLVDQAEALESALWQAIRALQQKSILARQTVREECTMSPNMRARFEEQALASEANADLLMRLVQSPIFSPTQEELNAEGTSAPPGSEPPEGPNEPAAR